MIGLTLIEWKQLHCFYFYPLKHDCFELKGPWQHQGNIIKQTNCLVSKDHWQAPVNPEQTIVFRWMKTEKGFFYPYQPII